MALRLEHFTPAEESERNLFLRRVGKDAIDDFLQRGQIAGTDKYNREAYFLRGGEWATGRAPWRISIDTTKLNVTENPLYGNIGFNRYLMKEGVFPVGGTGGGTYPRLSPNPDVSWFDTVNPANRRGIRIDNKTTGDVLYDTLKPVKDTSLRTNINNLKVDAKIAYNATVPHVEKATSMARTGAGYGVRGLALYGAIDAGLSVPARHEAYERGGNNWLLSQAAAQSDAMLNFMSLGGWDAIEHGKHRGGTRGDYRGEMSNIQTPRLGLINEQSVHANPNRYERQGVSLDHALSLFR